MIKEIIENLQIPPAGYVHFTMDKLKKEKIKALEKLGLSKKEIDTYLYSMPNSTNRQDLDKKYNIQPQMIRFLNYEIQESPSYMKYMKY